MNALATRHPSLSRPHNRRVLMALAYYEHRMHLGIARYARESSWILDTSMAHYGAPPTYWRGHGVIALALPDRDDLTGYLRQVAVPVVALTADVDGIATARVVLDNERIGRIAAEHLLERGFKSLAFLKCTDYADIRGREAGFAAAVNESGLDYVRLDWNEASRNGAPGDLYSWLQERLLDLPKPVGVMTQSDHRAYLLLNACESAGLAVPEQVAVVGVDNDEYTCEFAPVPITSVDSNRQELAYRAAQLLDRLMRGEPAPSEPVLVQPAGLVVRRSSDILAIEDADVANALSFIWQHFREKIGVEDVVAATTMSRCGLYRAFERFVGRAIRQELERKRIEYAQRLLATSASTVDRIARLSGFANGERFCRAFVRTTGSTPSDFRRRSAAPQDSAESARP